ncbi:MAG: hypothetical protein ACXWNL_16220 [Vulcanimicrobiaceae bacterium]
MLIYHQAPGAPDCRIAIVPPCEQDGDASQSAPIAALACFQMKIRDTLDFTVDFSQWIAANGNPVLSNALFAAAVDSPSAPSISGQAFTPGGKCVVVLHAAEGAKAGDAYYLDITATLAATVPASVADVVIPARTLVRRIHVVLTNG